MRRWAAPGSRGALPVGGRALNTILLWNDDWEMAGPDRALDVAQYSDMGGMIQTVMLLARGYGLHSCAQQAWASWPKTVSAFLELPDHMMLYSGMSLG